MRILIPIIAIAFLFQGNVYAQLPNEKFQIEFTKYTVSSTACTRIVHSSGSIILIPENAFALDPKSEVDSVDVYYRVLLTPLDIISHGIPMDYAILNKKVQFESNGMFEIWAKSNEDPINIHEDKSIEVRLAMSDLQASKRMEGYLLDPSTKKWKSYTNRIRNNRIDNTDDDLWGSSPVQNEEFLEEEGGDVMWAQQDSIRRVAFQAMEIFDFGLYNYDKIIDDEIFISVEANFVNQSNQEALKSTIYIVYDDLNSVFYFPPYTWAEDFSIIQNKSYKLFSIDTEGNIYRLKDFPEIKGLSNQAVSFQLQKEGIAPQNRQELSKLTGLQ